MPNDFLDNLRKKVGLKSMNFIACVLKVRNEIIHVSISFLVCSFCIKQAEAKCKAVDFSESSWKYFLFLVVLQQIYTWVRYQINVNIENILF